MMEVKNDIFSLYVILAVFSFLPACGNAVSEQFSGSVLLDESIQQRILTKDDYMEEIHNQSSSLLAISTVRNFDFRLKYTPVEIQALNIFRNSAVREHDSLVMGFIGENKNTAYFTFSIRDNRPGVNEDFLKSISENQAAYAHKLEYLSFKLQHDFMLIDGFDTLSCNLFHYERGYDAKPVATFVMCFALNVENKKSTSDYVFSYDDTLLGLGRLNFKINKRKIQSLPQLLL